MDCMMVIIETDNYTLSRHYLHIQDRVQYFLRQRFSRHALYFVLQKESRLLYISLQAKFSDVSAFI